MYNSSQFGLKRPFRLGDGPEGWNNGEEQSNSGDGAAEQKRKRRSRWNQDSEDKTIIPGMPTVLPSNLTESQQRQYVVHLQIEEITRKLRTGDLGIPANPEQRSPSPEPIYNNEGKRMNTREYRTRKRLEEDRHKLIQEALKLNPEFKPPGDYKPPIIRVSDKVMIPQEEHPEINFVGLLIGPRGNTLKNLEKESGAKIIIRGKGSVKDGKIGRKDGQPLPGEDEPLHAYVTANNPEHVRSAVDKIKEIIRQGIEVPEGQNDLRKQQLRELALLNGTLRENDGLTKLRQIAESQTIVTNTIICTICGGAGHIAQDCKQKRPGETFHAQQAQNPADRAKMDSEYMSLMAELGEGPPPPPKPEMSAPFNPPNFGRTLLSNPPPNPMAMNSPWQMNNQSPFAQQMNTPLLNCPPAGMPKAPPQINPLGRLPLPSMSSPMQAASSTQSPPGLVSSMAAPQAQPQQSPMMGSMGNVAQMQQQRPNLVSSWQMQQAVPSQGSQSQNISTMNNPLITNSSQIGVPQAPASILAPPPPPPPANSQTPVQPSPPWMQQPQGGKTPLLGPVPPPPPPPPPPPSESTFTSNSITQQQQNLLNIQNQVLLQQQQKIMQAQSSRMGDMNRGNQQSAPNNAENSANTLGNQQNMMRSGQEGSFNNQYRQGIISQNQFSGMSEDSSQNFMFSQGNTQNSSQNQTVPRGGMENPFTYSQMAGSHNQTGGNFQRMMNDGNSSQSMKNQGGNIQSMMNQRSNSQSMMNQDNNTQNNLNQLDRDCYQNLMNVGSNYQNMVTQGSNPRTGNQGNQSHGFMSQVNNSPTVINQGSTPQNMMNPRNGPQNMISRNGPQHFIQGNNSQQLTNQGNGIENIQNQETSPQNNNIQGSNNQRWRNFQSGSNVENHPSERVRNSNMWN